MRQKGVEQQLRLFIAAFLEQQPSKKVLSALTIGSQRQAKPISGLGFAQKTVSMVELRKLGGGFAGLKGVTVGGFTIKKGPSLRDLGNNRRFDTHKGGFGKRADLGLSKRPNQNEGVQGQFKAPWV